MTLQSAFQTAQRAAWGIKKDLFSQHLMHKLNNHGSFAHCRGDTFHALSPDVANRENSGKARFKQIRGPVKRPAVSNLCTGLNESLCRSFHRYPEHVRRGL